MKEKVSVTGVPETMIQTLYARAKESEKVNPMIQDDMAAEIVSKLVGRYLGEHPKTVVINIASGMDTRCYRMEGKYLRWYNIDLPETMEIREKFLTENGPIYQIAKSAMDASYTDEIVCDGENVLVVIEGLSMYLQEKDVLQMFSIIEKTFPKVTVMIETMSPFVVRHIKEKSIEGSNAKFTWGIKNGKLLQQLVPAFTYKGEVSLVEGMKKMMPIYRIIGKIPAVKNFSNKIIVLEKE